MLGVMNACAFEAGMTGGAYDLPGEAGMDPDAARAAQIHSSFSAWAKRSGGG